MPVTFSGIRSTSAILVPQGGTGNAELTSGSLLVGNGTSPVGVIAPGSEGQILTVVSGVWAAANNAGGNGGVGGAGISAVSSSGNLQGDGTSGSVLALKDDISLTTVTASFSGNGSNITGLASSQISDFNTSVDARITNIPNAALQNSSITINGSAVSLGGSATIADQSYMQFTASGFAVGDIVSLSGSLVKADYSDNMKSNAFGAVSAVSGTNVTVKVFGEVTALSASLVSAVGTPMYVGPSGSVVQYTAIPVGSYITQVGYISPSSGKVVLQPRVFGQK